MGAGLRASWRQRSEKWARQLARFAHTCRSLQAVTGPAFSPVPPGPGLRAHRTPCTPPGRMWSAPAASWPGRPARTGAQRGPGAQRCEFLRRRRLPGPERPPRRCQPGPCPGGEAGFARAPRGRERPAGKCSPGPVPSFGLCWCGTPASPSALRPASRFLIGLQSDIERAGSHGSGALTVLGYAQYRGAQYIGGAVRTGWFVMKLFKKIYKMHPIVGITDHNTFVLGRPKAT